jgi:hypothetical protein
VRHGLRSDQRRVAVEDEDVACEAASFVSACRPHGRFRAAAPGRPLRRSGRRPTAPPARVRCRRPRPSWRGQAPRPRPADDPASPARNRWSTLWTSDFMRVPLPAARITAAKGRCVVMGLLRFRRPIAWKSCQFHSMARCRAAISGAFELVTGQCIRLSVLITTRGGEGENMRLLVSALLSLGLLGGCAGYAIDYTKPKTAIVGPALTQYGLDARQSACVSEKLTASLSVWQLRQLAIAVGAVAEGQEARQPAPGGAACEGPEGAARTHARHRGVRSRRCSNADHCSAG